MVKRGALVLQVVLGLAMMGVALGWVSGDLPRWKAKVADLAGRADGLGRYGIVPLGWGPPGRVREINAAGMIAGSAYHEQGRFYAALWHDGETTSVQPADEDMCGEAVSITDDGAVAYSLFDSDGSDTRSYVYEPGAEPICLNDLVPGAVECRVRGMNQAHVAVGTVTFASGARRTFRWSREDGMTLLDTPLGLAMGINDSGVIVGSDRTLSPGGLPCIWTPLADGGYHRLPLTGDRNVHGRGYAINNAGVVVGRMSGSRPIRWDAENGVQVLAGMDGCDGGWAFDINDRGDIVGCLNAPGGGIAMLWRDGNAHDLNRSIVQPDRWRLVEATAINNDGFIACRATFDDQATMVLLVPMQAEREVRMAGR